MLEYVALVFLIFVGLTVFYGIIVIHDIPYEIAVHRKHPHQDAINVAGWVSILTLHVIWPFLWIWATLYRPDRGWGFADRQTPVMHIQGLEEQIASLQKRVEALEKPAQRAASVTTVPVTSTSGEGV